MLQRLSKLAREELKLFVKFTFLLVVLGILLYVGRKLNFHHYFSDTFIAPFGSYAPLVFIILSIVATLLFFPGTLLSIFGTLIFGMWEATLYVVIGGTIGSIIFFYLTRHLGKRFVRKFFGKQLIRVEKKIDNYKGGWLYLNFYLRNFPMVPFNVANIALGLSAMPPRPYIFGTFFGLIPSVFVFSYMTSVYGTAILDGSFSFRNFLSTEYILPIVFFALLFIVPVVIAKFQNRKTV